jgi:hypothetical protein
MFVARRRGLAAGVVIGAAAASAAHSHDKHQPPPPQQPQKSEYLKVLRPEFDRINSSGGQRRIDYYSRRDT